MKMRIVPVLMIFLLLLSACSSTGPTPPGSGSVSISSINMGTIGDGKPRPTGPVWPNDRDIDLILAHLRQYGDFKDASWDAINTFVGACGNHIQSVIGKTSMKDDTEIYFLYTENGLSVSDKMPGFSDKLEKAASDRAKQIGREYKIFCNAFFVIVVFAET